MVVVVVVVVVVVGTPQQYLLVPHTATHLLGHDRARGESEALPVNASAS